MLYEDNGVYIPLRVILKDVVGYYNTLENSAVKKMGFQLSGNLGDKIYDIFENIREKADIDSIDYVSESTKTGIEYLKMIVSSETLFDINNYHIVPSEKTKSLCNVLLQIQSVWYSTKDKDVVYYSQILLEQCCYEMFINTKKIDPRLKCEKKFN